MKDINEGTKGKKAQLNSLILIQLAKNKQKKQKTQSMSLITNLQANSGEG